MEANIINFTPANNIIPLGLFSHIPLVQQSAVFPGLVLHQFLPFYGCIPQIYGLATKNILFHYHWLHEIGKMLFIVPILLFIMA